MSPSTALMSYKSMIKDIRSILSENKIRKDIVSTLSEAGFKVELDGGFVEIRKDVEIEILYRRFVDDVANVLFTPFLVCVSVGNANKTSFGSIEPAYCFALINYNEIGEVVSTDFLSSLP